MSDSCSLKLLSAGNLAPNSLRAGPVLASVKLMADVQR